MATVKINDKKISFVGEKTILEVALQNGVYIPHLCFHPTLSSTRSLQPNKVVYRNGEEIKGVETFEYGGCHLCLGEI